MRQRRKVPARLILSGIAVAVALPLVTPALAAERLQLTWWQAWTNHPTRVELINSYIKGFSARYPGVTVEPVFVLPGELGSKARVAIAGGAVPDVLMLTAWDLAAFAHAGMLVPLDEFANSERVNLRGFNQADLQLGRFGGKLYGLPHISGGASQFIIYHKELFAKAGLPDQAPATWKELKEYAKKLTRSEGGKITQLGYNGYDLVPYLYSNNGTLFSPDARRVTFQSAEAREVFALFTELQQIVGGRPAINQFYAGKEGSDENSNFPFYLGQIGMMLGWQAIFKNIGAAAPGLPFGVGVMPANDLNPKAEGHGTTNNPYAWFYVIPKGVPPERQLAAFRWIAWLTANTQGGALFPMTMGRPAPWMEVNRRREYFDTNPEWGNVIKVLMADVVVPVTPVQREIMSYISQAQSRLLNGQMSGDAALEEAARLAQAKLDEAYAR